MSTPNLIAHWSLACSANDIQGQWHGCAHNVTFGDGPRGIPHTAAIFNTRDSFIEIPDAAPLRFGNNDFTVTAWIRCALPMRSIHGDIFSKFDAEQRCGINLWVAGSAPGYNSMSDARHVYFGTDDGYMGSWEDCGRPWPSNPLVPCLVVHKGELYCGLSDADRPEDACHVFRWGKGREWIDCGRLGEDPAHLSVMSMLVHNGELYAGTGLWDWDRAAQAGRNIPPAGLTHVFRYEGGKKWRDLGQVGRANRVMCMASFDGELYAGLDRSGGGGCFKFHNDDWVTCGTFGENENVECLMPLNGTLYGASHSTIYRYEGGTAWKCIGRNPHDITQIHAMSAFNGRLIIGTWPQGYVLRYEDNAEWSIMGRLGLPAGPHIPLINEINALTVHHGKLYAGVLPKAQVYRYECDGHWTLLGNLSSNPAYDLGICPSWNRVLSLTTHQDRLFAATGTSQARAADIDPSKTNGRIMACQIGHVVGHEHDIGGAWTHIAAVRRGEYLRLYINGTLSAESAAPANQSFDLTNAMPLRIGSGAQGSFAGSIADVRLYRGAMNAEQIVKLPGV